MTTAKDPAKKSLRDLTVEELLDENNRLATERRAILERQREITAEIEVRATGMEDQRRAAAAMLGQTNRPRTQGVFGEVTPDGT